MYFILKRTTEFAHDGQVQVFAEDVPDGLELIVSFADWQRLVRPNQLQIQVRTYHEPVELTRDEQ